MLHYKQTNEYLEFQEWCDKMRVDILEFFSRGGRDVELGISHTNRTPSSDKLFSLGLPGNLYKQFAVLISTVLKALSCKQFLYYF